MGDVSTLQAAWTDRRYADAWAEYRRLQAVGEAGAAEHLTGARAALELQDVYGARSAIERACQAEPRGRLLGEVRLTQGVILLEVGEYRTAAEVIRACIEGVATEYPEIGLVMLGVAWFNLGLCYRMAGKNQEAVIAYRHATGHFRAEHMDAYLCMALHNLAWAACILGQREEAGNALAEAEPLCTNDDLHIHHTIGAAFLQTLGDIKEKELAMSTCQSIYANCGEVPAEVRSQACWLSGRVALELGLLDMAESLAQHALHFAGLTNGTNRCLSDAATLHRQVHEARVAARPTGSD